MTETGDDRARGGPWWWERPRSAVLDVTLAAASAAECALQGQSFARETGVPGWLAVVLGVVAGATLVLRRRWPIAVVLVAIAVIPADMGATLCVVGLYTLAATEVPRRITGLLASMTALGTLAMTTFRLEQSVGQDPDFNPSAWFVPLVAVLMSVGVTAPPVLLGLYVGARRRLVESLRERADGLERELSLLADRAEERAEWARNEERTRIAREMHDVVAHRVSLMVVHAAALQAVTLKDPEKASRNAALVGDMGRQALNELRTMLGVLRSGDAEKPAQAEHARHTGQQSGRAGRGEQGDRAGRAERTRRADQAGQAQKAGAEQTGQAQKAGQAEEPVGAGRAGGRGPGVRAGAAVAERAGRRAAAAGDAGGGEVTERGGKRVPAGAGDTAKGENETAPAGATSPVPSVGAPPVSDPSGGLSEGPRDGVSGGGVAGRAPSRPSEFVSGSVPAAAGNAAAGRQEGTVRAGGAGQERAPYAQVPSLAQLDALVGQSRAAGMAVELRVEGDPDGACPPTVEQTAYRVVQEALTNVHKHAAGAATRVRVAHREAEVALQVENEPAADGAADAGLPSGGNGLVGMRERVTALGGGFVSGPTDSGGFRVSAIIPYARV
ncbi:sensor histidine kinase [Streptomyces reniochalinae]|uniref:histidine kinase n=1 Tax=Streptomyces reniochalinae TaxID=2250578 RepID=A0A367EYX4_9ACTN|nr:histidine kinase [Streptomyces reniochalinae]RCG23273.1 sensor histidine kinase [Streptomyces reniochalinae]